MCVWGEKCTMQQKYLQLPGILDQHSRALPPASKKAGNLGRRSPSILCCLWGLTESVGRSSDGISAPAHNVWQEADSRVFLRICRAWRWTVLVGSCGCRERRGRACVRRMTKIRAFFRPNVLCPSFRPGSCSRELVRMTDKEHGESLP